MLNIVKSGEGEKLVCALEGRLDTTTAPQLEAELKGALDGVKELVLDFEKLEYISSAGLRRETTLFPHPRPSLERLKPSVSE